MVLEVLVNLMRATVMTADDRHDPEVQCFIRVADVRDHGDHQIQQDENRGDDLIQRTDSQVRVCAGIAKAREDSSRIQTITLGSFRRFLALQARILFSPRSHQRTV